MTDDRQHSTGGMLASVAVGGGVAYVAWRVWEWWNRDEDGPQAGWGVGFGTGNGWVNLNPFDKGKAGTGDGGGDLDGDKWERVRVAGVKGWRRKGVPLPKEPGGPETYQAAVLIVGNNKAIPELGKWPGNLPVFFVNDPNQDMQPLFDVRGGWGIDARFGESSPDFPFGVGNVRTFDCAATTSSELTKCIKAQIEDRIPGQWV